MSEPHGNNASEMSELISRLLSIGATLNVDDLFAVIVREAPRLVGAEECSIFWRDGSWRDQWRKSHPSLNSDEFYRRATYEAKKHLIGIDGYPAGLGLTGWVAKSGKALRIKNITDESELRAIDPSLKCEDRQHGYKNSRHPLRQRAFLAIPIKMRPQSTHDPHVADAAEEVVGVIRIAKTQKDCGEFTAQHEEFLSAFAARIGALIWQAEERKRKEFWEDLYLTGVSGNDDEFEMYLANVANSVPKNMGADVCSIFLVNQGALDQRLVLIATTENGPLSSKVNHAQYSFGEGLTGWVAKSNKTLRIKDVSDLNELHRYDPNLTHKGKHDEFHNARSAFLACPISVGDKCLGVMRVALESAGRSFTSEDQRFLEYFCRNLAVLVKSWLLIQQLRSDKAIAQSELEKRVKSLSDLRQQLFDDISTIRKGITEMIPEVEQHGRVRVGPVLIDAKAREKSRVFVAIPFSTSAMNVYRYGIKPALSALNLEAWCGAEQRSQIDIMRKTLEGIQECHLGIVDISDWNPNVFFELGVLYGQDHPVILLKRDDAKVPADLAGVEHLPYGDFAILKEELQRRVEQLLSLPDSPAR